MISQLLRISSSMCFYGARVIICAMVDCSSVTYNFFAEMQGEDCVQYMLTLPLPCTSWGTNFTLTIPYNLWASLLNFGIVYIPFSVLQRIGRTNDHDMCALLVNFMSLMALEESGYCLLSFLTCFLLISCSFITRFPLFRSRRKKNASSVDNLESATTGKFHLTSF